MSPAEISKRDDLNNQLIIIEGDDLHAKPSEEFPFGGVMHRAEKREKYTENYCNQEGLSMSPKQKRNYIIGEVAELAAVKFYEALGFDVDIISWKEFNSENRESAIDLFIHKKNKAGELHQKIQVKGSEFASRSIYKGYLDRCRFQAVNKIVFVAVKEVVEPGCAPYFVCRVLSEIQPHYIKRLWQDRGTTLAHPDNTKTIREWSENKIF